MRRMSFFCSYNVRVYDFFAAAVNAVETDWFSRGKTGFGPRLQKKRATPAQW